MSMSLRHSPDYFETRGGGSTIHLAVAKREDKKIRPPVSALVQKLYDTSPLFSCARSLLSAALSNRSAFMMNFEHSKTR